MFKEEFGIYVVHEDSITCVVDGFTAIATLHHDGDTEPQEDDPELESWRNDEWHYFGVTVTIWRDGAQLTVGSQHSCWGIEGNYPVHHPGERVNLYFRDVANDLLIHALTDAKTRIRKWAKELENV